MNRQRAHFLPPFSRKEERKKKQKKKDLIKSFTVNVVINFRPHAIKWLLPAQKFDEKVIAYNYTLWVFYLSLFLSWNHPALRLLYMVKKRVREGGNWRNKKTKKIYIFIVDGTKCLFPTFLPDVFIYYVYTYLSENVWNEHGRRHAMPKPAHTITHTHDFNPSIVFIINNKKLIRILRWKF